MRVSQAFVREDRNQEVFTEIASDYSDARVNAQRLVAIYFPFVDFLSDIATCIVLGAGSVLVANGSLSVGSLVAFLLYLALFFAPIQQLVQLYNTYQQGQAAVAKLRDLLATYDAGNRWLVTSRPSAVRDDWLSPDGFTDCTARVSAVRRASTSPSTRSAWVSCRAGSCQARASPDWGSAACWSGCVRTSRA